jgi:Protein of unknown function (DUF5672)
LRLPEVTLCAATSVNLQATVWALQHCLDEIEFRECLLFTDRHVDEPDERIRIVPIPGLSSASAYSEFMLTGLAEFINSPHCLVIQWDGFVIDGWRWDPAFLNFDYIGAPWPQFDDGHDVGNGGFSLRSRKLLKACRDPEFRRSHPEDIAICRINRDYLESKYAIRFADRQTAGRFAFERTVPLAPTFGFHGIFNITPALSADRLWQIYASLDDRATAWADFRLLMRQLGSGDEPTRRRMRLSIERLKALVSR